MKTFLLSLIFQVSLGGCDRDPITTKDKIATKDGNSYYDSLMIEARVEPDSDWEYYILEPIKELEQVAVGSVCRDGTLSRSFGRGTCSWHGGVAYIAYNDVEKIIGNIKKWYKNGKLHRIGGPAFEGGDGYQEWWQDGKLHRIGGPAVEGENGYQEWWQDGKLHRLDGPAKVGVVSGKEWYVNGQLHREGGPAIEDYEFGRKYWYLNGKLHREGGPAIENSNGYKAWYINGVEHRTDGPAAIDPGRYERWYLNGKCIKAVTNDPYFTCEKYPNGEREVRGAYLMRLLDNN